jgi:hypothetical protein
VPVASTPLRPPLTGTKSALLSAVNVATVVANVAAQLLALIAAHDPPVLRVVTPVAPIHAVLPHAIALGRRQLLPALALGCLLRRGPDGDKAQRQQRGCNNMYWEVHIHSSMRRACRSTTVWSFLAGCDMAAC